MHCVTEENKLCSFVHCSFLYLVYIMLIMFVSLNLFSYLLFVLEYYCFLYGCIKFKITVKKSLLVASDSHWHCTFNFSRKNIFKNIVIFFYYLSFFLIRTLVKNIFYFPIPINNFRSHRYLLLKKIFNE